MLLALYQKPSVLVCLLPLACVPGPRDRYECHRHDPDQTVPKNSLHLQLPTGFKAPSKRIMRSHAEEGGGWGSHDFRATIISHFTPAVLLFWCYFCPRVQQPPPPPPGRSVSHSLWSTQKSPASQGLWSNKNNRKSCLLRFVPTITGIIQHQLFFLNWSFNILESWVLNYWMTKHLLNFIRSLDNHGGGWPIDNW